MQLPYRTTAFLFARKMLKMSLLKTKPTDLSDITVALIGNPNSGKTTLFNLLTGLNQKTGNFPGVTVDKKSGNFRLEDGRKIELVDLPGCYSIYPKTLDEQVVQEVILNENHPQHPDLILVVADTTNLKRNLLLFSQVRDLGIPCILILNMIDVAQKRGLRIDTRNLQIDLGVQVITTNSRTKAGVSEIKKAIAEGRKVPKTLFHNPQSIASALIEDIKETTGINNDYKAYQLAQHLDYINYLPDETSEAIQKLISKHSFDRIENQKEESRIRYEKIEEIVERNLKAEKPKEVLNEKIDKIITHPILGYVIFFGIILLIFQAIFAWAELPMTLIENAFAAIGDFTRSNLPSGVLNDLLTDGIIAGLAGVIVFIPQIAILFAFISLLEETGYMSRAVFLMDKIMRNFGLSGKSVVPLVSGMACAIPAIMSTRSIESWKDRLITIFVTPFMSCSARLPVYTILIGLIISEDSKVGFFNMQGLALTGMYLLGFIAAIGSAALLRLLIKAKHNNYFVMELPAYKLPNWKNVGLTIYDKTLTFVVEAGKVIIAISIILWAMASYGFNENFKNAGQIVEAQMPANYTDQDYENQLASFKLENSLAGSFGKAIEPVIKPLGYDWKIGIALITSFAAREVFVGTISTIYSIGANEEDELTIRERLRNEVNPDTGGPMYTTAVGLSLMVFYAFAMQCMSTLAVVYRETKGWKWPLLQLAYMTAVAYGAAFLVYQYYS